MTEAIILNTSIKNMQRLEGSYARQLTPIFNSMWRAAAAQVDHGNFRNADLVVDKYSQRLRELLQARYLRTAEVFGQLALQFYAPKSLQLKAPLSPEFWGEIGKWAQNMAALRVTQLDMTSKRLIADTILRGIREGQGTAAISKDLRTTGIITSRVRANTIARTETHTAANYATRTMVSTLGANEKKWLDSHDKRVRSWHQNVMGGEWIKMADFFSVGGEEMEAPGIGGSGKNTINCRCVAMYRIGGV